MNEQELTDPAMLALEAMSDDEISAWIAAGDYSSIGEVALSADVVEQLSAALAGEVTAFGLTGARAFEGPSATSVAPVAASTQSPRVQIMDLLFTKKIDKSSPSL